MEWNQPLFTAFMFAVVGNLFAISTVLIFSPRKSEVKPKRGKQRERYPVCTLADCPYRMKLEINEREFVRITKSIDDPTESQTGRGDDEMPPVG